MRSHKGFTPLEKINNAVSPVRKVFSNGIRKLRSLTGFTLTEIVVSAVVLALLAAGVFSAMLSGKYLISRSKNRARAVEIAKYHIDDLRQHIRADRWNDPSPYQLAPTGAWSGWSGHSGTIFEWRYRVSGVGGFDCRQVDVQVRWSEPRI